MRLSAWVCVAAILTACGLLRADQVVVRRTPPLLLSISPSSGAVAASVTITGTNFGTSQENSALSFNGTLATASAWSSTSITVLVPVGATTGNVTVTRGGQTSNGLTFTVTSGLPPGVTLTAIDGGNTYYADSGWTYATATFTVNGATYAGWDDPAFFPIATFLDKYASSTHAARWVELGLNTGFGIQGDVNLALMNTNGHQLFIQTDEWVTNAGNNIFHAVLLPNVAGIYSPDEPGTTAAAYQTLDTFPCSGTPVGNTGLTNRPTVTTFQHSQISFFDVQSVAINTLMTTVRTTLCGSSRTLGLPFVDEYFYNGASAGPWPGNANATFHRTGSMTDDMMKRGVRYTDLVKFIRLGNTNFSPSYPAFHAGYPAGVWVETGTSYAEDSTEATAILPAQINAAVWGSLIGGARFVAYFSNGDALAWNTDSPVEDKAFWDTPITGQTISNYDQLTATNTLVTSLAPILNSPFATGYLTVSPSEQVFTQTVMESGYATMVKYYNRGPSANNKFYIFALPRYGNRTHNNSEVDTGAESWPKTATFTIPNTGSTQVTVINESRTISVTGGGTTFSDSFATRETVHIYRVD